MLDRILADNIARAKRPALSVLVKQSGRDAAGGSYTFFIVVYRASWMTLRFKSCTAGRRYATSIGDGRRFAHLMPAR